MRDAQCEPGNSMQGQRGMSLVAALFIIVVLAFMGVMFLSMISTSTLTSVNDMQSMQAFNIAEGGVEYAQYTLSQNLDWYRSATDPIPATTQNLGVGSFVTSTTLPATKLRLRLRTTDTTASVYTTDRFPSSGYLLIDNTNLPGGGILEFVQYTGKTATTFTNLTRGVDIGSVPSITNPNTYLRNTDVYPVAQLATALTATCSSPGTISMTVLNNSAIKFLSGGTLDILGEEIRYTGLTVSGLNLTLSGITRCLGPTPSATANIFDPVTPVLVGGVSADYQSEVTSTGTVGGMVRVVKKTVQR